MSLAEWQLVAAGAAAALVVRELADLIGAVIRARREARR